jgi:hypothetical protein
VRCARGRSRGLFELRCLTYYGLSAFNVIDGRCVLPRQDALAVWYMTAEFYHLSVLCIGVHDLGGAEWSCQRCTGPTFGRVSISLTSHGHLTLALTPVVHHAAWGSQVVWSAFEPTSKGFPTVQTTLYCNYKSFHVSLSKGWKRDHACNLGGRFLLPLPTAGARTGLVGEGDEWAWPSNS